MRSMTKRKASSEPPSSESTRKRPRRDIKLSDEDPTILLNELDSDSASESENIPEICPEDITVAIFCALSYEAVAVKYSLDEEYACRPSSIGPQKYVYSYGRIKHHNVVITRPHYMGTVQAAHCASAVRQQFPNMQFAITVGTGSAISAASSSDIRLGDVAVGIPRDNHPGVIQYDFGKYEQDGFTLKGCLSKPPGILISADGSLEEDEEMGKSRLKKFLKRITRKSRWGQPMTYDASLNDRLDRMDEKVRDNQSESTIDSEQLCSWRSPVVHRGLILSGNGVVNNLRDSQIFRRGYKNSICFETESAGIMDEIPCLVVRGICDYADTHKQEGWHRYASAVAAAYCKAVLYKVPEQITEDTKAVRILAETVQQLSNQLKYIYERVHDLEQSSNKSHPKYKQSDNSIREITQVKKELLEEEDRSREENKTTRQYNFHAPVVFCENATSQEQMNT
ncbi:purine and uridine phosphorylase [Aspergillus steynii IBT 23096]|uniref:Purine and uridine phosphorylase n=1 Tax=Aspergillus steynii IBT 23096 TaxID=1392250 RepID=A0A2I2FU39_9EURO|nr:purine and uridine phosphorylase [Aspergillus steynii IBT 23096]PLB44160.1 purine and uridine phosphorylase [Aspergillus steynii IBT 23096]